MRLLRIEQLVTGKLPDGAIDEIRPLKTLQEVEIWLKAKELPFAWRRGDVDSSKIPPGVMAQLDKLPPGEVFVLPQGERMTFNVILSERPKLAP